MLTDKDIHDIKVLAYKSGMDYFVKERMPAYQSYVYKWRLLTNDGHQYNKNHKAVLYQRVPFESRTLHAVVAEWYNYPNFINFERTLLIASLPLQGIDLRDIYDGLHPDFELKNLHAIDAFYDFS